MDISNIRWIVLIVVIFGNEIDPATDIPVIDNEIVKWDDVKCNIQLFGISNFRVRQNIYVLIRANYTGGSWSEQFFFVPKKLYYSKDPM